MQSIDLVDRIDELRLNISTAQRIQVLWRQQANISEVEKVIALDAVLASRLLKLANSEFYGSARAVSTLGEAVFRIGIGSTRDLAWALSLNAIGAETPVYGHALQRHGIEVAAGARLLARYVSSVSKGDAFVAGLLHDLGMQVMLALEAKTYLPLLERYGFDDIRLIAAERKEYGLDHAALTSQAMVRWNLPQPLVDGVGRHHTVRALNRGTPDPSLALPAVLFLAERMAEASREELPVDDAAEKLAADPVNAQVRIEAPRFAIALSCLKEEVALVAELLKG